MTLYNYRIFYILLYEMPQMENILISQSKNTNIVIAQKERIGKLEYWLSFTPQLCFSLPGY